MYAIRSYYATEEHVPVIASIKAVVAQKDKSALYILISLFLWFSAHAGVVLFSYNFV